MATARLIPQSARVLLLAACVWPAAALGQSLEWLDAAAVFPGNVITLRVDSMQLTEVELETIAVRLPPGFELVAIRNAAAGVDLTSADLAGCSRSGTVYVCPTAFAFVGAPLITIGSDLDVQTLDFMNPARERWRVYDVEVRFTGCTAGPTAAFLPVDVAPRQPALDACAAPPPSALALRPVGGGPAVAPRGALQPLLLEVVATTGSGAVIVTEEYSQPGVLASRFQCRRRAADPWGSCAALSAFAVLGPAAASRAQVQLTAVNVAEPEPGDLELLVTLATGASAVAAVSIEQPVQALVPAATPPVVMSPGTVSFGITSATNAVGGNEPAGVIWSYVGVSPTRTDIDLDALVRGWLAADVSSMSLPGLPPYALDVHVQAAHANPDGTTTTAALDIPVSPVAAQCWVTAEPTVMGVGASSRLRVESVLGTPAGDVDVEWRVASGQGAVTADASDPLRATYTAALEAGNVRVQASLVGVDWSPYCDVATLSAELAVVEELQLRWMLDARRAEAGKLVRARAALTNVRRQPLTGLVLRVALPPALGMVQPLPRTSPGAATQVLGDERGVLTYSLTLDASAEQSLDFAFLARAGNACGPARLAATLHRTADGPAIGVAETTIDIACEPELAEATVFGRVFADANGNGVQEEGETGIPGALVASAAGVHATTDADGNYHLNRLAAGRHTVKLDRGSLAAGTEVGLDRREVTLTPGAFVRVSFPVRPPTLSLSSALALVPARSGVALAGGTPVYRARFRLPVAGELWAGRQGVRVDATELAEGEATLVLPMDGDAHWLVALQVADGRTWLWSFAAYLYEHAEGGWGIVPWGPRPLAALGLPAAGTPAASELTVRGELREPLALTISTEDGKASCALAEHGKPVSCAFAGGGARALRVSVDPGRDGAGDDPPLLVSLATLAEPAGRHFVVGRAGVELAGIGEDPRWDGGGAFLYRGTVAGDVLVTAGADLPARELLVGDDGRLLPWSSVASRLLGHDPRRVFRDLDPESYYPTYGDGAVVVDEREAGGRFFARVQAGRSFAKWGGINTAVSDVEYGQYVRSLYGFGAQLELDDPQRTLGLRAVAFGARPDSVAARDELLVTGGSLYFLAHRDVVEGSVRVALEVLDEISGLAVRVVPLTEGLDFEADYLGGWLSLDPALPQRTLAGSLTGVQLGGDRARLLVDYEYYPGADLTSDLTAGGRVTLRAGPVSVGATAVAELATPVAGETEQRYRLLGATTRLDLGPGLRLRVELARSEGQSHLAARSVDGGLTFTPVVGEPGAEGDAATAELSSEVGGVSAAVYGRYVEPGFADSRTLLGTELRQAGVRAAGTLGRHTRLWAQSDRREERPIAGDLQRRDLALAGVAQTIGVFDVGVEGRYELLPGADARRIVAAAELGARPWAVLRLALRRRQVIEDAGTEAPADASATSASAAVGDPGGWRLGAEGGVTDDVEPFARVQAALPLADGTELYASYLASAGLDALDPAEAPVDELLVGGRRRLADGSLLYSEQRLAVDGVERRLTRTVGAQASLMRRLALVLSYERGTVGDDWGLPDLTRDAGSLGAVYQGEAWSLRLGADARLDESAAGRSLQLGGRGRLELRVSRALTLAAGGRGASTYALGDTAAPGRQAWEASAGFALRPVETERVSAFGRYALVQERTPASALEPRLREVSHVAALAIVVNVVGPLDLGPKAYYRHTRLELGAYGARDQAAILALRGDWHLEAGLDVSAEARACEAPGSRAQRAYGGLVEASALALEWLRLGAGYNLSEIAAESVRCAEPGARGLFVRAEVVY